MLTSTQFESLGRFALAFNEIEYFLQAYIEQFIGPREWAVSSVLVEEGNFSATARRFRRILQAIAEKYPALKPTTEIALKLTKEAEHLAEKRNQYVHALVVSDTGSQHAVRIKRSVVPFDMAEVANLTKQAQELVERLDDASAEVLLQLQQQW